MTFFQKKLKVQKSLKIFTLFTILIASMIEDFVESCKSNNYYNENFTSSWGKKGCLGTKANVIDSFLMKMLVRCLVAYNKVGI